MQGKRLLNQKQISLRSAVVPRLHPAFGSKLQLQSVSPYGVAQWWIQMGHQNHKCSHAASAWRCEGYLLHWDTRCRHTLAPSCSQRKAQSSSCRAARNTWGRVLSSHSRPARTEPPARHPADFRYDAELLCQCFVRGDFKEHLITCSYVSRSCHLSILLSWLWKKVTDFSKKCIWAYALCARIRGCTGSDTWEHGKNCLMEGSQLLTCPNKACLFCDVLMPLCFPVSTAVL